MDFITYISIVLVLVQAEALMCLKIKKKFDLFSSLLMNLMWPIGLLIIIAFSCVKTKGYDKYEGFLK